jgi:hypothetical protein
MNSKSQKISIGATVRIAPQHWLRGYEEAVVVGFTPGAQNNWLVQFNSCYLGGGIDGDKLWMDESQLTQLKQTRQEFVSRSAQPSANPSFGHEGRDLQ